MIVGSSVGEVCGLCVFDVVHGSREGWWVGCGRRRCSVVVASIWGCGVVLCCVVGVGGASISSVFQDVLCYGGGVIGEDIEGARARRCVR